MIVLGVTYRRIHEVFNQPQAYSGTLQLPYTLLELWKKRLENPPDNGASLVACVENDIVGSIAILFFSVSEPGRYEAFDFSEQF